MAAQHQSRTHSRSSSEEQRLKLDPGESDIMLKTESIRTDSPENDSAFSDTVSMLSSESSASSGGSGTKPQTLLLGQQQVEFDITSNLEMLFFVMSFVVSSECSLLFLLLL